MFDKLLQKSDVSYIIQKKNCHRNTKKNHPNHLGWSLHKTGDICKALLYGVKYCHKIPQQSSAAWQNFPQATLALKLNLLTPIFSSTQLSAKSSLPLAIAPTTTQTLSSGPRVLMYSRALTTCASQLNVTFRQFGGRYCVTGCLITLSSFSGEVVDRIDNL